MPIDYSSTRAVVLSVDTSYIAIGFILSQEDEQGRKRPARYGSIPLSDRESRYSQPKLELYGLFRALRAYRLYLVGVKKLKVEVDAKYIKGMLNDPDLQPNASTNRWIQGILLFDFELVHVPAEKHQGPDRLSRKEKEEGEIVEEDDDSSLDDIALFTQATTKEREIDHWALPAVQACPETPDVLETYVVPLSKQDQTMVDIYSFLKDFQLPEFKNPSARQ